MALIAEGLPNNSALVWRTFQLLIAAALLRFFYNLYRVRTLFKIVARQHGLPMLPHSFVFGHLIEVGKLMAQQPYAASGLYLPLLLLRKDPNLFKCGVAYIDTWPIGYPMMAVYHPDMMAQFTQDTSLPKHQQMATEFYPFTQLNDLVNQEGREWKMWRSIFNPGFSSKNLMSFVPQMMDEVLVFRAWLQAAARSGNTVTLEEQASKLTFDIIGRAVLGVKLHCQTTNNPLYQSLKSQIWWIVPEWSPENFIKLINPIRPFVMWNNNRLIKKYILPHIQRGISEHGQNTDLKTINGLAIKAYLEETKSPSSTTSLDSHFINVAIQQMKMFLFAGHDTTASAICFAYHFLWTNPSTLAAIRAEHDAVLGANPADAAQTIRDTPQLLNQLPYTSGVIKESLRLFPPVGTVRQGQPGFFLTNPDTGVRYPTDGFMLFGCSMAEQRSEEFWPRPDEFVPERWLAKEGDALHVRKNTFRPFELGPRNCIGQELAQLELRAILALTVRELDVQSAYPEDGGRVLNELAYQTMAPGQLTGHPFLGMPAKLKIRT